MGEKLTGVGYIDLSKRRVSPEDIVKCEERFNKGKMVASIMRHVAEKTKTPMETLYQDIGWPLNKKYGHAVDAFKLSITYVSPLQTKHSHALTPTEIPTSGRKSPFLAKWFRMSCNPTSANGLRLNLPRSAPTWK